MVNNDYQQDSRVLYTFVPNKSFGSLLDISLSNHIFLKTFSSEYDEIIVWFTDQNSKPLEIEDRINLTADSYIFVKGIIAITGAGDDAAARQGDERDKGVTFKNCAPFTKCISRINNRDMDNAHDIDIVMPVYDLIEYSDNYSKTSGSLWQYYKGDPNDHLTDSESFKSKVKITGKTPNNGNTKDVEIIVPLKYLSNFWRTLEMPLINCEG